MKKFIPIIAIILVLMISLALYFGLTSKRYEEIHFSSESELLELDNSENKFNVYKNHEIIHLGSDTYLYFGMYPKTVVLDESLISNLDKLNTVNARGNYYYNGYEYKKITRFIIHNATGFRKFERESANTNSSGRVSGQPVPD